MEEWERLGPELPDDTHLPREFSNPVPERNTNTDNSSKWGEKTAGHKQIRTRQESGLRSDPIRRLD